MQPQLPSHLDVSTGARQARAGSPEASRPPIRVGLPASTAGSSTLDVHRYLRTLAMRWRLVAVVALVVLLGTAIGTMLQDPIYRATGTIELRGQNADVGTVEALFESDRIPMQYLETQYGVLRSGALSRMVIADLGRPLALDLGVEEAPGATGALRPAPAITDRETEAFAARRFIDPVNGSNLVKVHYESRDPALAARVVASVFENYAQLQSDVGLAAVTRLAAQVDSTRARLALDEERLQAFAQQQGLDLVDNEEGASESLPQERLRTLQRQLTEAEAERYARQSQLATRRAASDDALDSEVLRILNVRLAALDGEYAKLRSTFAADYPRAREVKDQLDAQKALLARERARIRGQRDGEFQMAVRRQTLLQAAVDSQRAMVDRQGTSSARYRILGRDAEAQRQLYAMLREKLQGARVSAAMAAAHVSVIEPPTIPGDPARPLLGANLLLGAVVGLALGIGAAFYREYADGTMRTVEDVDALAVPLLGIIPAVTRRHDVDDADAPYLYGAGRAALARVGTGARRHLLAAGDDAPVTTLGRGQPGDPRRDWLDDAFASLRTSVLLDGAQGTERRSLLVTSLQPGDGKTTTCVNLAISLARLGRRVLLVDADTRRPAMHRALGTPAAPGLTEALGGGGAWLSLVHAEGAPGLDVLPAGRPADSPVELLSSPAMAALIDEAEARYDYVLLDAPALLINAADTRILATMVDGVIVVVRSGSTPRAALGRLVGQVPNLLGVVLNRLDIRQFAPSYYADRAPGEGVPDRDAAGVGA